MSLVKVLGKLSFTTPVRRFVFFYLAVKTALIDMFVKETWIPQLLLGGFPNFVSKHPIFKLFVVNIIVFDTNSFKDGNIQNRFSIS